MPTLVAALLLASVLQTPAPSPLADLTPDEHVRFDAAAKSFHGGQFAMALPVFKSLLLAHPDNLLIAKYASEAALDTADRDFASATLKPIEAAHPDDWQAAVLLTRLYAETGDKANRDKEMAKMADLQKRGVTPPTLTQYIVEKDHLPNGRMVILWTSLVPWGNYKVYNYARVLDANGKVLLRITLESGDFDQPAFAREHPQEAAFGDRRYSIDTYSTGPVQANGQRTETQGLIGFLDKKPTYDEVRARFLDIAQGKGAAPAATNEHPAAR
jgi:hypothetical protein